MTQGIVGVAAVLRVWPGWGFGGRQSYGVIRDWGYTARHGRFPAMGGVDPEAGIASVTTPVLAVSVDGDQYTPPATTDHLCAVMRAAPIERIHVTSADAGATLDHFAWVRASAAVARHVARFAAPS
jgi:predicted alpha/beta hydrolase